MSTNTSSKPREFERPVAWLLGKQLLNSLKGILLYSAYGGKIDPRDWMTGKAFRYLKSASGWSCDALPATSSAVEATDQDEFWFDYLSDSGDGEKAVYSLAYMAMANLWTRLTPATTDLRATNLDRNVSFSSEGKTFQLPRGQFLFFGGDTAYHAAEYMTLVNRIQRPFRYAYEDLRSHQLISDADERRNVFGIPGNHDYYDQLDGFRRQFRKPVRPEGPPPPKQSGPTNAQLSIPAYQRVQEASYLAISLPFGWWFWGLDVESPVSDRANVNVDRRQKSFFEALSQQDGKIKAPDKLIVATCAPSTVFGRLADAQDPKVARAMDDLGIEQPFLPAPDTRNTAGTGDDKLKRGQCRLDLSGDVHHYSRYWGPDSGKKAREKSNAPAPSAQSYASIVSGAGGAFHHPSATYDDEICEQVLYPTEEESRREVAKSIFKFWNVWSGGRVWLFGLIIAFSIYFGAVGPTSSRQFISQIPYLEELKLTTPEKITPIHVKLTATPLAERKCDDVTPFLMWRWLGIAGEKWPAPEGCRIEDRTYFLVSPVSWPLDLKLGQWLIVISFIAIVATLVLCAATDKIFNNKSPFEKHNDPANKLWPIIIGTTVVAMLGLHSLFPYRDYLTPFSSSLLVLFSIFAAITAIVLSLRYGEYRYKKSFVPGGSSSQWLEAVCWVLAVVVVGFTLPFFGQNNLPAFLVSDLIFVTVLVGTFVAIMLLPFKGAADLLYTQRPVIGWIGKFLIGVWHLLLQIFVPYILVRNGNYVVWGIAALLVIVFMFLGQWLLRNNSRVLLALSWLVFGAMMLGLPSLVTLVMGAYEPIFQDFIGWKGLTPSLIAAGVGAIICCLWTGWYFGVCFAFNGHNNEVGGAARIERFKEFVRFRLTKDGLTGYVIAVDDVDLINEKDASGRVMDGSDLKPKIIDVFHLVPKP